MNCMKCRNTETIFLEKQTLIESLAICFHVVLMTKPQLLIYYNIITTKYKTFNTNATCKSVISVKRFILCAAICVCTLINNQDLVSKDTCRCEDWEALLLFIMREQHKIDVTSSENDTNETDDTADEKMSEEQVRERLVL